MGRGGGGGGGAGFEKEKRYVFKKNTTKKWAGLA